MEVTFYMGVFLFMTGLGLVYCFILIKELAEKVEDLELRVGRGEIK